MLVHEGVAGLRRLPPSAVLSIGNFDGYHLGHAKIVQTMTALRCGNSPLAVATFEPHPLTVLRPNLAPPRLTTAGRKQKLLADAGIDHLVILPPTREVLDLTAEAFWRIIADEVRPKHLVEGASFNFGRNRGGTIARLREWTIGSGIDLHVIDAVEVTLANLTVVTVSSSLIRWLVSYGRMRDAAACLGRPYRLIGPVVHGAQRGRTIGVPTANLQCPDQLLPADGVYAGRVCVNGRTYRAAVNIGAAPTFDAPHQIEAHLIGFDGDLYGRILELVVTDWLRDQQKFTDVAALKRQLMKDLHQAAISAAFEPKTVKS